MGYRDKIKEMGKRSGLCGEVVAGYGLRCETLNVLINALIKIKCSENVKPAHFRSMPDCPVRAVAKK